MNLPIPRALNGTVCLIQVYGEGNIRIQKSYENRYGYIRFFAWRTGNILEHEMNEPLWVENELDEVEFQLVKRYIPPVTHCDGESGCVAEVGAEDKPFYAGGAYIPAKDDTRAPFCCDNV